ncbi:MAG: LysE family transporter [Bacteroidales bacterium]|nr:LysE family transporter [Bacteroidales bacterium]
MTSAILEGAILGLTLAFLIGPAFIALVQTSIHQGLKSGLLFAAGISLSDITLIFLSYLGAIQILTDESNQFIVGIIGGLILIVFGIITFFKKYKVKTQRGIEVKLTVTGGGRLRYLLKGFFMNILNPFLLIFWLGVMSFVSARFGVGTREVVVFFVAALTMVFLTDTVKCLVASHIGRYLNISVLIWVNRIVGFSLMAFGVIMFIRVFINFM